MILSELTQNHIRSRYSVGGYKVGGLPEILLIIQP
jgi:hypothetical protein